MTNFNLIRKMENFEINQRTYSELFLVENRLYY